MGKPTPSTGGALAVLLVAVAAVAAAVAASSGIFGGQATPSEPTAEPVAAASATATSESAPRATSSPSTEPTSTAGSTPRDLSLAAGATILEYIRGQGATAVDGIGLDDEREDWSKVGTLEPADFEPGQIDLVALRMWRIGLDADFVRSLPQCGEHGVICAGDGPAPGEYYMLALETEGPIQQSVDALFDLGVAGFDPARGEERIDSGPAQFTTGVNFAYSIRFTDPALQPRPRLDRHERFEHARGSYLEPGHPSEAWAHAAAKVVVLFVPVAEWGETGDIRAFGYYSWQETTVANGTVDTLPDVTEEMTRIDPGALPIIDLADR